MKNLSKTYKFVYISKCDYHNRNVRQDYVFGNRMPSRGSWHKWDVSFFFHRTPDNTMRKHFSNKKVRIIKSTNYLNGPANEANITLAFVKYFTYELNQCRRRLTYLNKEYKSAETDTAKYPHGLNPMGYNVFSIKYYQNMIKQHKQNLAIWKAKYQELKDSGMYTYLELVK